MSDRLIVIGITGLARAGKDTVAKILESRHGFFRIGLADGVRAAFSDLDGPTWELRKEIEAAGSTARKALQTIGTEARLDVALHAGQLAYRRDSEGARDSAARLWVHLLAVKIRYLCMYHPAPKYRFVVPDMRFADEHYSLDDLVHHWGGEYQTWRIHREGAGLAGDSGKHASETEIDRIPAHAEIQNHGTIGDLEDILFHQAAWFRLGDK